MDNLVGGELYDLLNEKDKVDEEVTAHIIQQLLRAVLYLHKNNVVHRNLQLENIMLVNDNYLPDIKLTDFGAAVEYNVK